MYVLLGMDPRKTLEEENNLKFCYCNSKYFDDLLLSCNNKKHRTPSRTIFNSSRICKKNPLDIKIEIKFFDSPIDLYFAPKMFGFFHGQCYKLPISFMEINLVDFALSCLKSDKQTKKRPNTFMKICPSPIQDSYH